MPLCNFDSTFLYKKINKNKTQQVSKGDIEGVKYFKGKFYIIRFLSQKVKAKTAPPRCIKVSNRKSELCKVYRGRDLENMWLMIKGY